MQKRNVLDSPRLLELKKKKKKILIRKIVIFAVIFLLLISGLSYISQIKRLNINEVKIEGNKIIDTEKVVEEVNKITAGKYIWLFPKTNILLYPKSKIKRELSNKFKRFSDITLGIENSQALKISVAERTPEYTWCGAIPPYGASPEICYFLDKEGYIFDEAPYFSGEVYFKFYGVPEPNTENPAGSYVAKGYFDKLILFKNTLTEINLKPAVMYIQEGEDVKIFLSKDKTSSTATEIIFKKDSDYQKIAENLKAALDTEPLLSKVKTSYSSINYIDLRFGNKVYYKFK